MPTSTTITCPGCRRKIAYDGLGATDVQGRPVLAFHYTRATSKGRIQVCAYSQRAPVKQPTQEER